MIKRYSFSSINLHRTCNRTFFYKYIQRANPTDKVEEKYGKFGNVCHESIENLSNFKSIHESVNHHWLKEVESLETMSIQTAYDFVDYCVKYDFGAETLENEMQLNWEFMGLKFVAHIDRVLVDHTIIDWKTSTFKPKKKIEYEAQTLFYAWAYWKIKGVVPPRSFVVFGKAKKVFPTQIDLETLQNFEKELAKELKNISGKENFDEYDFAKREHKAKSAPEACFFCAYKKLCRMDSYKKRSEEVITLSYDHYNCKIENSTGVIDPVLLKVFEDEFSYMMDNAHFAIKAMRAKGNMGFDGRIRLFKTYSGIFPRGFLNKARELLDQYKNYRKDCIITIEEENFDSQPEFERTYYIRANPIKMRPYQDHAIEHILKEKRSLTEICTGCVDMDTEYFNGYEWKKISEYKSGKIMQYNKNGTSELIEPKRYIKIPSNDLYHIKTRYGIDQVLSLNHNVVFKQNNILKKLKLYDVIKNHEKNNCGFLGKFITTFIPKINAQFKASNSEIKLLVAIIADGNYPVENSNLCIISLKKERKIIRLINLLKECGINYKELKQKPNGSRNFRFYTKMKLKEFNKDFYNCNLDQLNIISEECLFWDGDQKKRFSTCKKNDADFIQYVFTSCGYRATINIGDRIGQKYSNGYIRKSLEYSVNRTNLNKISIRNTTKKNEFKKIIPKDGFQYCFEVNSGMLVLRRNNNIFITGNSGKTFMAAEMIKRIGYKTLFVVDVKLLMDQTKNEFINFFDGHMEIGEITDGKQNWKWINVATIQTVSKLIDKKDPEFLKNLHECGMIIIDEAHSAKSKSYKKLIDSSNSEYFIGLTGTAFANGNNSLELYRTFGFPDYKITTKELVDQGYLTEPEIKFLSWEPKELIMNGDYEEVYNQIIMDENRLDLIRQTLEERNAKHLIIVSRVEHAEKIEEYLSGLEYPTRIIQGKTPKKARVDIMDQFKNGNLNILIGTAPIVQKGLDIPNLDVIINVSGNVGWIQTIQTLGRVLRKFEGKNKAYYYDFNDKHFAMRKHTRERIKALEDQGYDVMIE